jgi:hypothetical protein
MDGGAYSRVYSNGSSDGNRRRISRSLYHVPLVNLCSSSGTNVRQSLLDTGVIFLYISTNVYTGGDWDQTRPSAAWRIGLLGTGRHCTAGCCGACVDYGCASPGLEGAG